MAAARQSNKAGKGTKGGGAGQQSKQRVCAYENTRLCVCTILGHHDALEQCHSDADQRRLYSCAFVGVKHDSNAGLALSRSRSAQLYHREWF